jgi:hypothetical protein
MGNSMGGEPWMFPSTNPLIFLRQAADLIAMNHFDMSAASGLLILPWFSQWDMHHFGGMYRGYVFVFGSFIKSKSTKC